ncbi:MAG: hypothetical protein AUG51_11215 [Acidobacteria bacterium 13_1_20CM_3_53_8]|nr:MAG: hypothetical protein AUG51_11215 [Acidobacteria bacterium 13_1_20CM_3_53_8]
MRKFALLLLCLVLFVTSLVPVSAQDRRHRSRFGRKARTAAIVGGGALAGAAIGHGRGAAIGAGAAGLYAMNRGAARRHFKRSNRRIGTVASGALLGAGVGGHGRGAAIGAATGAVGSYIYTKKSRHYRRRY